MGRPSLPADIRASVVGRIQAGQSASSVARQFGICHTTALAWYRADMGKSVGETRGRGPIKHPRQEWADLYRRGLTTGRIAKMHNVPIYVVVDCLQRLAPSGRIRDLRGDHG